MDEQTRKALELAREAISELRYSNSTHAADTICDKATAAIDAALSAPAAPAMQWRKVGSGPWWDGCPDESDGCGPYETRIIGTAPAAPVARCLYCDDTGDVHAPTGEWRGRCTCAAGAAPAAPVAQPLTDADVLLRVIQRLNANPYSLTKSECISEIEAMIAHGIGQGGAA